MNSIALFQGCEWHQGCGVDLGIGLHIIESLRAEHRLNGEPGYRWFYRLGYCVCISVVNARGQVAVWKHLRHYLSVTDDTSLGENMALVKNVCADTGFVTCVHATAKPWDDTRPAAIALVPSLPAFGEVLNISSVLVMLGLVLLLSPSWLRLLGEIENRKAANRYFKMTKTFSKL